MDYPTAWKIAEATAFYMHEEECSYRQTDGMMLCDCEVLTGHPDYIEDYKESSD